MTAIIIGLTVISHILVFVFSISAFVFVYKQSKYTPREIYFFTICFVVFGCLGFFIANHMALLYADKSIMVAMGYATVPITQISLAILSYPIVMLLKERFNLKFAAILLGIIASAPFSFILTTSFSVGYWQLLGHLNNG